MEFDGHKFDSQKEAQFFRGFIHGRGLKYDVHKSFQLHPMIELDNGVRLRSSKYTPDIVVYNNDGEIMHVYDVKSGFNTTYNIDPAAALRFKLFTQEYGVPVEVVVPRTHDFKVKIVGTTKKANPIVKNSVAYKWQDAVLEMTSKEEK